MTSNAGRGKEPSIAEPWHVHSISQQEMIMDSSARVVIVGRDRPLLRIHFMQGPIIGVMQGSSC